MSVALCAGWNLMSERFLMSRVPCASNRQQVRYPCVLNRALGKSTPAIAILIATTLLVSPMSAAAESGPDQPVEQNRAKAVDKPAVPDDKPADKADKFEGRTKTENDAKSSD